MAERDCAECGHGTGPNARFCDQCGAALTPGAKPLRPPRALEAKILDERTWIEGERKQVTVMYTDIVGSMLLTRALQAERWGLVLDRFLALCADAVHTFEGTVNQFTGDGLLAVFGAPVAHEDHARRACLAVLDIHREAARLAAELGSVDGVDFAIRCGLNSGEVVVGAIGDDVHMDFVPLGNTTAVGKRLESLAPAGSTAIGAATAALVEGEFELQELGEFALKGAEGHQRVFELIGPAAARTRLDAVAATRGLSRFVGRARERAALESALAYALVGDGRAVGIVGDPGVGKSRLVREFVADCAVRGLAVASSSGVAHGRHLPLMPVLALYRDLFGIDERDAPEVARGRIATTMLSLDAVFADDLPLLFELLGVGDLDRPPPELHPEAHQRRLLTLAARIVEAFGRRAAAVLVIEDLHWLDDASSAFVEALVAAVAGTRVMLIVTYRPEHDATWTTTVPHAELALDPLDAGATGEMLSDLLGRDDSLDGLSRLIEIRTGGNPFFIEEIVEALTEKQHLDGTRGRYRLTAELEDVLLPPTVQAALTARIDRLPAREKALLNTMSVIGKTVPGPVLSEASELDGSELADAIAALEHARILVPDGASGAQEHTFKHPLTQEVAYGSQLSEGRARAHRAVAAAIQRAYPNALDEGAALLALHHEAGGDTLEAAEWHARAATWAERTSPSDGLHHWRRVRLLVRELEASAESDELDARARTGILGLGWRAGVSRDEIATIRAETPADAERLLLDLHYAGTLLHGGREQHGLELFRRIDASAVAAGDPGVALTVSLGVVFANWMAGSLREGADAIDRAIRLTGGGPRVGAGLVFVCPMADALQHRGECAGYMGDLQRARRDFGRAIELARAHGDPETESYAYANLALLQADVGANEAAADSAASGLAVAERLGNPLAVLTTSTACAVAAAAAGRPADALARARANLAEHRRLEIGLYDEPRLLATIARCELALGRPEEALAAAEEAVDVMDARGLATCALTAPITLARILIATHGAAAGGRIEAVLARATSVTRDSGARVFEPQIRRELDGLARLRDTSAATRAIC